MATPKTDLSIADILADPIIRTMMKADRVEPRHLEAMLRGLAAARSPANRFLWTTWCAQRLPSPLLAAGGACRR